MMSNRIYFAVLAGLIAIYILLIRFCFPYSKFIIWGAVPILIYIICKDIFTGQGWFSAPKRVKAVNTFRPIPELKIAVPLSDNEKQGYLQLMHHLVAPTLQPILEPFINELKTFDNTNEENTPLYSLAKFADQNDIPFIMGMDIKAAIDDLEWRIQAALKVNYSILIDLPSPELWPKRTAVSNNGVLKSYNEALTPHGFQLGFIDTQSAEYMLMVFKIVDKDAIETAVSLTGYKYYDVLS